MSSAVLLGSAHGPSPGHRALRLVIPNIDELDLAIGRFTRLRSLLFLLQLFHLRASVNHIRVLEAQALVHLRVLRHARVLLQLRTTIELSLLIHQMVGEVLRRIVTERFDAHLMMVLHDANVVQAVELVFDSGAARLALVLWARQILHAHFVVALRTEVVLRLRSVRPHAFGVASWRLHFNFLGTRVMRASCQQEVVLLMCLHRRVRRRRLMKQILLLQALVQREEPLLVRVVAMITAASPAKLSRAESSALLAQYSTVTR